MFTLSSASSGMRCPVSAATPTLRAAAASPRPVRGKRDGRARRNGFVFACLVIAILLGGRPASAQNSAPTKETSAKDSGTSDVVQLIEDMDDIDAMRPLLPLKLTPEQMDKMAATITSAQVAYDKKLKALAGPALAKLADQIRDVKQKTLKGELIPKEFDSYVKLAEREILAKRKTLNEETIALLSGSLETILTPEQFKMAAKMDKDAQIKLGKAVPTTQKTEPQWFASYVNDVVFTVPRLPRLLKQMRAASEGKSTAADTSGGAGK